MDEKTRFHPSFPADSSKVGTGGLLAEWSESQGCYILAERTDEDTWTLVGKIWAQEDARHIVEGWIAS